MMRAVLNNSWKQQTTKWQRNNHLPPISQTILVKRKRHMKHCWRSKDELITDITLWTSAYERVSVGWSAKDLLTYVPTQDAAQKNCRE